ncbi:ABC transporter substrate-binding protein [Pseudonocardia sp.]|uniref:ABC transporter substrate-binding protein n=1 Tax=Pseudonocardia sp. TaxID=60912 RepID=UPI003D11B995
MAGFDRRTLLRGGIALGAAAAAVGGVAGIADLATASRPTAKKGTAPRIGYLPITDAAPLLVAHGQNRYAQAGVEIPRPVLFRGWESLAQAFVAGEVDVVHLLMPFALQLRYQLGAQVRMVAWNHTNGSALTVRPEIDDVRQLAGTSVAIPFWWSIHNILLQRKLRAAGLTPVVRTTPSASDGTVQLVVMAPADMVPALDTGTISGYIVADPFNAVAEVKKVGKVLWFTGDAWRDNACCVVMVRQDLIDSSPQTVQALTDGVAGAQQWIEGNRPDAAKLLSGNRYMPQPLPAITKTLTRAEGDYTSVLTRPQWHGERIGYTPYPFPGYTTALVEAMRGTVVDGDASFVDRLDPATVHRDLVDDRFVRRSITTLGGPAAFGLPDSLTRTEQDVLA